MKLDYHRATGHARPGRRREVRVDTVRKSALLIVLAFIVVLTTALYLITQQLNQKHQARQGKSPLPQVAHQGKETTTVTIPIAKLREKQTQMDQGKRI